MKIPKGLCQCGCGEKTKISKNNRPDRGYMRGEPRLFVHGHNGRGKSYNHYRPEKVEGRFWEKVEKTDTCWLWIGARYRDSGYGRFIPLGKYISAHRYSYQLHKGEVPEGLQLDHLCRVRHCVNPDHLEAVTGVENIRRGKVAKLSKQEVLHIRKLYKLGDLSLSGIGRLYGVGRGTIHAVITKRNWKHV